jgi:hypothetical protein
MCGFVLLCGVPRGILAEEYVVYGLPLEVQKVAPIDEKQVVVVVRGRERIVAPERVNATLLQYSMAVKDVFENVSEETLVSAIHEAMKVKDVDSGVELLFFYLNNGSYEMDSKKEEVTKLFEQSLGVELFQNLLTSPKKKLPEELIPFLLAHLTIHDSAWVQENFSQTLIRKEKPYLAAVEELISKLLFLKSEPVRAELLLETSRDVYTPSHPDVQRFELLVTQYERLRALEPSLDRSLLYPFFDSAKGGNGVDLLRLLVVEKIHQFAAYAIEKGLPLSALVLLAELQPDERSERTQQLLVSALPTLDLLSPAIEEHNSLLKLLREESENSLLVRREWNGVLTRAIESAIGEGDVESATLFRSYFAPQSDQERERYVALALEEAILLKAIGKNEEARELVQNQGGLSLITRGRLYLTGYYGNWSRFAGVGLCVLSLMGFLFFLRGKLLAAPRASHQIRSDDLRLKAEIANVHLRSPINQTAPSQALIAEYEALLGTFSLDRNPTEEALRAAYRRAIKRVHPDLQPKDIEHTEGSDAFLKVSADYERLRELKERIEPA